MTPADHLRLLGPDVLAEIHRQVAEVPPLSPEVITELRAVLAPAAERARARMASGAATRTTAA